jgi:hypothetical protein
LPFSRMSYDKIINLYLIFALDTCYVTMMPFLRRQ